MYPSLFVAILLSRSILGLPFTSTTTASPAVSQISDGQVQAAAGPPSTDHSSKSGSSRPPLPNQDDLMGGSSVLTVKGTNSMGSLTIQTTAVSNSIITSHPDGQTLVGLPTTNSEGYLTLSTSTFHPQDSPEPQATFGKSSAAAGVGTPNDQQTSKEVSVTPSDLQTSSASPLPFGTPSVSIQATGEPALDMSMSDIDSISSGTVSARPSSGQSIRLSTSELSDTSSAATSGSSTILGNNAQDMAMSIYRTSSPEEQTLGNSGMSDSTDRASSSEPQSSMLPSEPTPVSRSTPRESDQTSAGPGGILDIHIPSAPSAQSVTNEPNGEGSLEVPSVGAVMKTPASTSAEVTTTSPSWVALPSQGSLGLPSIALPTITDASSVHPSLRLGDSITTQIPDAQGYPFPVIMVVTTGAGGSTSAQPASFLPVSYTQSDSEPTSTMDVVPPGLSIEEASNSLWTTNTWITTNAPGESEPTVVPVLVGCPGCGPPGHGLIVFGLPKIPRVQFHFPSIPKLPRFHVPCLRILGITIGSCSDESKLPEIITDPPEQGDVEQLDPQDEEKDPDTEDEEKNPGDETKSDDKQTSRTRELPEYSPYPESAATFSNSVPTANTDISASAGTSAAASSTSSAKNNIATTTPSSTTLNAPKTTESPTPTTSSPSQIEGSPSQPVDDPSPPPVEDIPSTPSIDPTAPPEGPSCNPAPNGPYEDVHETYVKYAAKTYCEKHKGSKFHPGDAELSNTYKSFKEAPDAKGEKDAYTVTVTWRGSACDAPDGQWVENPYGGDENMCYELLMKTWRDCTNNKGRGGEYLAGCLRYSMQI
ncbi:MAG: hypothetical protein Q9204_000962 [Flavoplaca sp. TL-2023a]